MIEGEMLYVVCYDISRDSARARVSTLLEQELVRVQESVFEGRMSAVAARRLGEQAAAMIGPDDSIRIYAVGAAGLKRSLVFGPRPLPERDDFFLV